MMSSASENTEPISSQLEKHSSDALFTSTGAGGSNRLCNNGNTATDITYM